MIDGENAQQVQGSQPENGQVHPETAPNLGEVSDCEPHVTHLLPGERELLAKCHRHGVYLAMCGALLAVSELASSVCEEQCERMVTYCQDCVQRAASENADAGLVLSPRRDGGWLRGQRGQS